MPLATLSDVFTHYDLHLDNILLYEPIKNGYITYNYHLNSGKIIKFDIHLKYSGNAPVINEINVISKPGKRIYCNSDKIPLIKNGLGMVVISTSHGVIADHEARVKNLGGELLLKIF